MPPVKLGRLRIAANTPFFPVYVTMLGIDAQLFRVATREN